jgi:hypothetical protein
MILKGGLQMYIKREDFNYSEGFGKNHEEVKRKRLAVNPATVYREEEGADVSKILIIGDEIFDAKGIDHGEIVTRTVIKKAYKTKKEEI